ncbi:hypothetical protein RYX36_013378 [Vicia faba]
MMVNNDDWSRAAMKDDSILVEFLMQLKHGGKTKSQPVMFTWGNKQPRSRSRLTASVSRCDRAFSTRCSPTTPLSWSGGASPSVTADGYEDSSRCQNHHAVRSKATATSGYTSNSASNKRCRKKKSFAELKEEESSLIKEKIYLEREIATKNANFVVMRTTNESLKRMKLGFGSRSHNKPSSTSVELRGTVAGQPHQRIVSSEVHDTRDNTRPQAASETRPNRIESTRESFFMIPDLNMMPSDDGMS